ncbi:hypothetical protein [Constantimarinum furrinae]|nr:hypothetical protein [Constantimarinum furrinae]
MAYFFKNKKRIEAAENSELATGNTGTFGVNTGKLAATALNILSREQ